MTDSKLAEDFTRFKMIGYEIKSLVEESKELRLKIGEQVENDRGVLDEHDLTEVRYDDITFFIKRANGREWEKKKDRDYTILFGETPTSIFPYQG